ncbi:DUF3159 domain-containing protein [Cellulomonas hominis]
MSEPGQPADPSVGAGLVPDPGGDGPEVISPAGTGGEPARGVRAITQEQFSVADAVGGVRGLVESIVPGLLFVVVYLVAGQELTPALVAAGGAAVLAVIVRLAQRTAPTQAFSGLIGVGIGVLWAWRSGQAQDYFAWGLWTNAGYLLAFAVSAVVGWPLVGLFVGLFRADGPLSGGTWSATVEWRSDATLRRRYVWVTWAWAAMFAARLAVQVPLYRNAEVAWLGTAKLAMGVPLTALVLWISWLLVRGSAAAPAPAAEPPSR